MKDEWTKPIVIRVERTCGEILVEGWGGGGGVGGVSQGE